MHPVGGTDENNFFASLQYVFYSQPTALSIITEQMYLMTHSIEPSLLHIFCYKTICVQTLNLTLNPDSDSCYLKKLTNFSPTFSWRDPCSSQAPLQPTDYSPNHDVIVNKDQCYQKRLNNEALNRITSKNS